MFASYGGRNKSTSSGAHLVPIGIAMVDKKNLTFALYGSGYTSIHYKILSDFW